MAVKDIAVKLLVHLANKAVNNPRLRPGLLKKMEERIYKDLVLKNPDNRPLQTQQDKYMTGKALLASIERGLERGNISKGALKGLFSVFLGNVFFGGFYKRREFIKKHGFKPPFFITISPDGACNLKCIGCYAASTSNPSKLPWSVFNRIIKESKKSWGLTFFVISGGEPLVYKSENKTLLDIAKRHSDCFFLMYTNGTLIDKDMAKRLAELGNITPAISVEGLEKETDERRGKGVFKKITNAMANLREQGVPFGISITATNKNAEMIISDEFIDFFFEKQGIFYAWIFHYMPIGREFTLKLLPTPKQRVTLLHKEYELMQNRKLFIADFWNSGPSSDGCICAARGGGYFYIDWNGNICPCVFIPYSVHNVIDLYKNGETLDMAINSPLFKSIRDWQEKYGYSQPPEKVGNWFRPCPIRDHYSDLYEILKSTNACSINEEARLALKDSNYRTGLIKYGEEIEHLTGEYWKREYLAKREI